MLRLTHVRVLCFFLTIVFFSFFNTPHAHAESVSVSCSGTSGAPTVVDESVLANDDITFTNGGGSGYCILDNPISAASVTVNTGVTITHALSDTDGITISTTGDFSLASGAYINASAKGCTTGTGTNGFGPNGSNVCTVSTAGYGSGTDTWAGGGGGAYGGAGGAGTSGSTPGGASYGSSTAPTLFGSSGGQSNNASYNIAGAGGGLIQLNISGNFVFNGSLIADGGAGSTADGPNRAGGGGSGGSIYVTVGGALSGATGSLSAVGGAGGNNGSNDGGGGGGGRIAIIYASSSFSGLGSEDFSVSGGFGPDGAADGVRGTVYVLNSSSNAVTIYYGFTYASDYSASSWTADATATNQTCDGSDTTPSVTTTGAISLMGTLSCTNASVTGLDFSPGGSVTFNALTMTLSAQDIFTIDEAVDMTITGNSTITANVRWTNLTSFTLDSGSSVRANALGCTTGTGTNGFGPNGSNVCTVSTAGYGRGTDTWAGGGGGAYGGAGGAGTSGSTPGGASYGSSTAPTLFGSSGGQSNNASYNIAGAGGGLIQINVLNNFVFNGSISANGGAGSTADGSNRAGGGGSGGSIYVTAGGTLSGATGSLSATGGAGGNNGSNDGGGGGGGRIAINYGADSYTGTLASTFSAAVVAAGGSGPDAAADGSVGTLSIVQIPIISSVTITDNSGYTNDATPVITLVSSGATPTHVAFSCDGTNWSSWLTYPDDDVANDGDGPAFNMTTDATNCSATNELKTIRAKIKDASTESSSVSDTTTYDTVAPTVSNVTSTNASATYGAGEVIAVTVQFSDTTMTVSGTPQIQLDMDGTDRQANYASTSTDTLSFTYTIAVGDNKADLDYTSTGALTLNGGTIADLAGNTATLTLASPGAAGSLGANKNIVIVTNQNPTVASVTATQGSDATGDVIITFIMDDPDNDNTLQAKIEYSLNGGSSWNDPTISTTGSETSATYGDPSVNNAVTYQVGQAGAYITTSSGANTVTIVWEAATDAISSTDIANAKIRVTPYDALVEGTAATSANFALDFVDPTGLDDLRTGAVYTTLGTLTWTPATDSNFGHYELWYASSPAYAAGRTGTAVEWDNSDDADLATATTSSTTIAANIRSKYVAIFAVDAFGNEQTIAVLAVPSYSETPRSEPTSTSPSGRTYTIELSSVTETNVVVGDTVSLSYRVGGTGTVSEVVLAVSVDGGAYVPIASRLSPYRSSYSWTPSEAFVGEEVRIRASATDFASTLAEDISLPFAITLAEQEEETVEEDSVTEGDRDDVVSGEGTPSAPYARVSDIAVGSYMRSVSWGTVYVLDASGVRRPFLDSQTFFTYANDFEDVVFVEDALLGAFPIGKPMLPKAGAVLVKIQSVPHVYAIDATGALRWIPTEEVARSLFGAGWSDYVIDVPVTAWSHFTFGESLSGNDVDLEIDEMKTRREVSR